MANQNSQIHSGNRWIQTQNQQIQSRQRRLEKKVEWTGRSQQENCRVRKQNRIVVAGNRKTECVDQKQRRWSVQVGKHQQQSDAGVGHVQEEEQRHGNNDNSRMANESDTIHSGKWWVEKPIK